MERKAKTMGIGMNTRIKELILQAGFPKFDKMYVVSDGEELVKFAHLIINEVCNELEISKNADPYTGEVFDTPRNTILNEQIEWLKEYFGEDFGVKDELLR